jgi:hypothetical protein
MLFIFSTPVLIRHLWQLTTVVFLHWCLMCAVLLLGYCIPCSSHKTFYNNLTTTIICWGSHSFTKIWLKSLIHFCNKAPYPDNDCREVREKFCGHQTRHLRRLCRAKDFSHGRDESVLYFVKTESFCYENILTLPSFA